MLGIQKQDTTEREYDISESYNALCASRVFLKIPLNSKAGCASTEKFS